MYEATIYADGKTEVIKVKEGEKVSSLLGAIKEKLKLFNFSFLYGGHKIEEEDLEKNIGEISNKVDKEDHKINLIGVSNRNPSIAYDENEYPDQENENKAINLEIPDIGNINKEKICNQNEPAPKSFGNDSTNIKIISGKGKGVPPPPQPPPPPPVVAAPKTASSSEPVDLEAELANIFKKLKKISPDRKKDNCDDVGENIFINNANNDIIEPINDRRNLENLKIKNDNTVPDNTTFGQKVFSYLIIEMLIIGLLFFLGCYFGINNAFNKSKGAKLGSFIPFLVLAITFSGLVFPNDSNKKEIFCNLTIIIFYIAFIVINCYLLSAFTKYEYILYELGLICLNFIVMWIYVHLTNSYNIFLLIFMNIIITIGLNILSYYFWIKKTRVVVNISIIEFVIILYISIIFYLMQDFSRNECYYGLVVFSYAFILIVVFIIFQICYLLYLLFSYLSKMANKSS